MRPQKDRLPDPPGSLFPGVPLFRRVTPRGAFWLLALFLLGGVIAGSCASVGLGLFQGFRGVPLLFSGIPAAEQGFFPCFTTFLLHGLLYLGLLFLLGLSVLGPFGVPALLFFKGVATGIGAFSFLAGEGPLGLCRSALCYLPAAAAFCLLCLFFGVRALAFSSSLARAGFAAREASPGFSAYGRDLLAALSLAVAVSLAGALAAAVFAVFFHL